MAKNVIGVRFKKAGKIYYFDPLNFELKQSDHVVVNTIQGLEYGEVAIGPREIDEEQFPFPVKPIIRKATTADDLDYQKLRVLEEKARGIFEEKVDEHGLKMKLVSVEYTFDKRKAVFYFTADGRVDFRNLVKDLAAVFHVRIELRQIGVRDEAKIFHSLGCCGRETCCSLWLGDFTPVSIKMAKDQNLSLNATKISGVCGRLLCCLTYENDFYRDVTKRMPKVGQMVETPDGIGQVYRLDMLREKVVVRFVNEKEETTINTFELADIHRTENPDSANHQKSKTPVRESIKKPVSKFVEKAQSEETLSEERPKNNRNKKDVKASKSAKEGSDRDKGDSADRRSSHKRNRNGEPNKKFREEKPADRKPVETKEKTNPEGSSEKSGRRNKGYFRKNTKKSGK